MWIGLKLSDDRLEAEVVSRIVWDTLDDGELDDSILTGVDDEQYSGRSAQGCQLSDKSQRLKIASGWL